MSGRGLTAREVPPGGAPFFGTPSNAFALSSGGRIDFACAALLAVLTVAMILPGILTLPMELWDESRNAIGAWEMAASGDWIVTRFDGQPDLWSTKPPLSIWMGAALMRAGLDPLLAIRLPSLLAAIGGALGIYWACRTVARDRLAGLLGGLFALCSVLYIGDHAGRTGDYDAPLTLFTLGFVLCAGQYIDAETGRSGRWIAAGAGFFVLAAMTKGVAAGFAVPGLLAYAIARRRLAAILCDWRLWLSTLAACAVLALWCAIREQAAPGFLAAMWANDVSGRATVAQDDHDEAWYFYPLVLVQAVQPIVLLLPALFLVRKDPDPARRRLCLLTGLAAASILLTISCARTKLYWYAVPMVPLLAIATAIALTTVSRTYGSRIESAGLLRPIGFLLLMTFWYQNIRAPGPDSPYAPDQVWYGPFLADLRAKTRLDGAVLVDGGMGNAAGFANYNPIAMFHAATATRFGEHIRLVPPDAAIAPGTLAVTCDPAERARLGADPTFATIHANARCLAGSHRPTALAR